MTSDTQRCLAAANTGNAIALAQTDDRYVNSLDAALAAFGTNIVWVGAGPNDGGTEYNHYRVNTRTGTP